MKKVKIAAPANGAFKTLSREQLRKVLGGDQCCNCKYGDGTDVDNVCDDGQGVADCCGPAANQMACFACDV